ncbi:IS605 OrfB family transposase [Thermodesulfitimonas autotrophica]|uniref:IS605 OrfB family transposase n=1 Tax=Thermodesulfitimonas autotrophica TaxID=1894989 RepID=A0A3N5AXJ9_9THEO|nr:transposase [Thermodesulfitimonas autotrophica]RPF49623.1 IS605 OrfB family transposase [Thermodesulfitimonas autotrophica]
MPKVKPDLKIFTVCGEFFPEDFPPSKSEKWSRGEENPLQTEMRLFSSCLRWAFKRLLEGFPRNVIKKLGQEFFGLNSRFVDDARLKAQAVLDSQKELLDKEIEETRKKLGRARKALSFSAKKLARAEKEGADQEKLEKFRLAVKGREKKVARLEKKLCELREHKRNGTVPKVVFGGRKLWRKVCRGKATRTQWRAARKNRLYSRGDTSKRGNPNIKVSFDHEKQDFYLEVTISHLSKQIGADKKGRPKMSRAPKVRGRLWLPEKHRARVLELLSRDAPYSAEIIRRLDGRYIVYLTFELEELPEFNSSPGLIAVDTNPDGLGLANLNKYGFPEPWPEGIKALLEEVFPRSLHKYEGEFRVVFYPQGFLYLRVPELGYASCHRRDYLIGVLTKAVVEVAKACGKPLALEDLSFGKDRLVLGKKLNRLFSNFPFSRLLHAVLRRAVKERVGYKLVSPRHTSTIGLLKYQKRFSIPVHCAAALVIGRRAMGLKEKITREIREFIARIKEKLVSGSPLPGEEKGMSWVRASLSRAEKKLNLHNGLCPTEQASFNSVWRKLKRLALAFQ